MVMVLVKITACVLPVFLCDAWLSTARLNPTATGAEMNEISAMKASSATSTTSKTTVKSLAAIAWNLKKPDAKQVVRKFSNVKSASSEEDSKSVRSHMPDEVDGGIVAFSADYHRPMHHPPKHN